MSRLRDSGRSCTGLELKRMISRWSMNTNDLPFLKEAFSALRRGRHLCVEDGEIYRAIESMHEDYVRFFADLGMDLRHHREGFYYLHEDKTARKSKALLLFVAVLVTYLDDKGIGLDQAREMTFTLEGLPHLSHEKYVEVMKDYMEKSGKEGLRDILVSMDRYGFISMVGEDRFKLRRSFYRLDDVVRAARGVIEAPVVGRDEAKIEAGAPVLVPMLGGEMGATGGNDE